MSNEPVSHDDRPPTSLEALDARLQQARQRGAPLSPGAARTGDAPQGAIGMAWRIGVELLAAMVVGVGSGLLLDRWLETAPWGLVVMFFLGAAAGVLNVYRAVAGLGLGPGYRQPKDTQE